MISDRYQLTDFSVTEEPAVRAGLQAWLDPGTQHVFSFLVCWLRQAGSSVKVARKSLTWLTRLTPRLLLKSVETVTLCLPQGPRFR